MSKKSPLLETLLTLEDLIGEEKQNIQGQWDELNMEKKAYEEMREKVGKLTLKPMVTLSIGGTVFKTRLHTLQNAPKESLFAQLFSGTGFTFEPDEDGSFFFDRDGTHFRYILNYLRGGIVNQTLLKDVSQSTKHEIACEAHYYGLTHLYEMIHPPEPPKPPHAVFDKCGSKLTLSQENSRIIKSSGGQCLYLYLYLYLRV